MSGMVCYTIVHTLQIVGPSSGGNIRTKLKILDNIVSSICSEAPYVYMAYYLL